MSKNLMDHVLMNKLDDELGSAIQEVGGDISGAKGPWDYAEIIKNQLCAKGEGGNIPSLDINIGPGLKIEEVDGVKYILATSGALTTCALNPPTGSYMQPIGDVIEAGTPIQKVLESLFYEILPKMPSLFKGDIIRADRTGADKYNEEDIKSGLVPNSVYLRLYISSRQEPVYILLSGHGLVNSESGSINPGTPSQPGESIEYIGGDSEYIHVDVIDNVITATLTQAGLNRFSNIEKELSSKASQVDFDDLKDVVEAQTTTINQINNKLNNIDLSGLEELNGKISDLEDVLDSKASKDELEAGLGVIGSNLVAIQSELDDKASKSDLDELKETVEGINIDNFATKEDLNALNEEVSLVHSDLSGLKETIEEINIDNFATKEELNSKASQSDLNAIESVMVTKDDVSVIVNESIKEVVKEVEPDPIPEDVLDDILK